MVPAPYSRSCPSDAVDPEQLGLIHGFDCNIEFGFCMPKGMNFQLERPGGQDHGEHIANSGLIVLKRLILNDQGLFPNLSAGRIEDLREAC